VRLGARHAAALGLAGLGSTAPLFRCRTVKGCAILSDGIKLWLSFAGALLVGFCGPLYARKGETVVREQSYVNRLDSLDSLEIHASTARIVDEDGGKALELEGVALIPNLRLENVGIEVEILATAPCYPGVAFRYSDMAAFELAYAVPGVSGQSDAIQYDPVFNGSNTWQLHTGPAFQKQATVPMGEWFTLRVDAKGGRAVIQVGEQPPLIVERLSHGETAGRIGLWSYRPAKFRNLRVTPPRSLESLSGEYPEAPSGAIDAWWLEGAGTVSCEPNGVLNLNRYLAAPDTLARLVRSFHVDSETDLELAFGFSDELRLNLDGKVLFEGAHTFSGFDSESSRGWVLPESSRLVRHVSAGRHELEAWLRVTEPFGWGLMIALRGEGVGLLPPVEKKAAEQ
jgi:hypothetical protein